MRIAFLSHKPHLNGLYRKISLSKWVEGVFLYTRFSKTSQELINDKLRLSSIETHTFGMRFLMNKLLGHDFYSPNYVLKLNKSLKTDQITHLVLFDFFHWYVLQALSYKRQDPGISLFIWSETKEWPKRSYSKVIMYLFVHLLRKNAININSILVYTYEGMRFMKELFPDIKVEVITAPIDITLFKRQSPVTTTPYNRNLKILCNARYSVYKNHKDLLVVIRSLLDAGYQCDLTLIGRVGDNKGWVEKIVREYGLDMHVKWLDPLPRESMPDLYRAHDVLVLPSYNEAIGMVVPEAMACGIPTITSDTVGANVYVIPGKTGLIFETGNTEELAEALAYYIDHPEVRAQHGQAAATHIKENYSVEKVADHFLQFLGQAQEAVGEEENLKNR